MAMNKYSVIIRLPEVIITMWSEFVHGNFSDFVVIFSSKIIAGVFSAFTSCLA